MKQIYLITSIIFLCLSVQAFNAQQRVTLQELEKELSTLSPNQRIVHACRYLDTLLSIGTPLPVVQQHIGDIVDFMRSWKDEETAGYLTFYGKVKKAFLPKPNPEILPVFHSALQYYENRNNNRYAGICHYFIGQHHYEQQHYGEAFYHHAKAQELFNKEGIEHIIDIGRYLHVMALDYFYFRDYDRVIQLMRSSITVPPFNENLDIQRYNTLALAYLRLDQLDSAAFYFKRTQEVARSWRDTTWIHLAAGNLGAVFVKQSRYQEALPLLMQDYLHNRHQSRHAVLARNAAVEIAAIWQKLGQPDSVLHYLQEGRLLHTLVTGGEPMWKQQRDEQYYLSYYEVFHAYHNSIGNTRMAYQYLDSLTRLGKETNLRYNKMTAQVAEDRLKIQQYATSMAVQEANQKRVSARLQLAIGIISSLALLMALLYYLLQLRRTKENLLAERDKAVQQAIQEKTEAQLAKANLEMQEYMLRLQEKNSMVKAFQQQINKLRNHSPHQSPQLDELTNRLTETKLLTPDDWNDFRQRFNRAFEGELDHLKMKHGDLTSAEERIYALEKMNISTSQMAWMLGISPESVRKSRYRLRKKMGTKAE